MKRASFVRRKLLSYLFCSSRKVFKFTTRTKAAPPYEEYAISSYFSCVVFGLDHLQRSVTFRWSFVMSCRAKLLLTVTVRCVQLIKSMKWKFLCRGGKKLGVKLNYGILLKATI